MSEKHKELTLKRYGWRKKKDDFEQRKQKTKKKKKEEINKRERMKRSDNKLNQATKEIKIGFFI